MSVRYLYRTVPTSKRLCSYYRCQQPILRNLALDKETGLIYHYGCLQTAKDEHFRCLDCGATLDGREINLAEWGDGSEPQKNVWKMRVA